jgi:hypothetical protein
MQDTSVEGITAIVDTTVAFMQARLALLLAHAFFLDSPVARLQPISWLAYNHTHDLFMQSAPINVGQIVVVRLIPVDVVQKIERGWLIEPKRGGREVHEVEVGNVVGHDWLVALGEKGVGGRG